MNLVRRTLILIVVLALPLAAVGVAMGAPKDCSEYPEGHPKACPDPDPPPPTTTTLGHAPGLSFMEANIYYTEDDGGLWVLLDTVTEWKPEETEGPLTVELTPEEEWHHIDLWNTVPGVITIEVTDPGEAGVAIANVRDSHPGDVCLVQGLRLRKGERVMTLPVPPATTNACGTEVSEADLDENCELNCEIVFETSEQTGEWDPLAMAVTYSSGPATRVVMTLTFSESPQP